MHQAMLLAIFASVIRLRERNPDARRRDHQGHREAVAVLASVLVLAITTSLAGPTPAIACAVGVFCFLAALAGQRAVDIAHEQTIQALSVQQMLPQHRVDIELSPTWPRQEAADLSPVSSLATHSPSRPQTGHPPSMQQKRDNHADHQELGAILQ